MLKRDFLMAQINKLTETVARALLSVEEASFSEAEEIVQQNYSAAMLDDLLQSGIIPQDKLEYEKLFFQLELLYIQLKINQQKKLSVGADKKKIFAPGL